jgi:hypothetical protein
LRLAAVDSPIRNSDQDVIKGGTLRITWISGILAALAAAGSTWDSVWSAVYKEPPSAWVRTAVLIAIVAVWGLIASADMLARSYATAKTQAGPVVVSLPSVATAEWNPAGGTYQVSVAAFRVTPSNPVDLTYLVLHGKTSAWAPPAELTFS